jgi:Protein of unknown function (DUF3102)
MTTTIATTTETPAPISDLAALASKIKGEYAAIQMKSKDAFRQMMNFGDTLIEAKIKVGHGNFGKWIEKECGISQRSVERYMRLAANRKIIEAKIDSMHVDFDAECGAQAGRQAGRHRRRRRRRRKRRERHTVAHLGLHEAGDCLARSVAAPREYRRRGTGRRRHQGQTR